MSTRTASAANSAAGFLNRRVGQAAISSRPRSPIPPGARLPIAKSARSSTRSGSLSLRLSLLIFWRAWNIECFHMADFEKWKEPFDFKRADGTRDQERHNRILNGLLDVIGRRAPHAFGFTRNVSKPSKALEDTYEGCIIDTVMHLANASAYRFNDKISIIFARHKDFASPRIEKYFGFMNYGDARLGTVGTDTPANLCQLQAADIIGYEISRMERDGVAKRYPLQKLSDLGCKFRFSNHIL
jgi:hypothetical protein